MVSLQAATRSFEHVTLVSVVLENDSPVDQQVRLENQLDGAVWAPRTNGVPRAGFDDTGWVGVVPSDSRIAVGYATPAAPSDDPAVLEWTDTATDKNDPSVSTIVRSLRDPRPPRSATDPAR